METKYCRHCGTHKPFTAFSKTKSTKDGLYSWCKDCRNAAHKARYEQDPEKYRKQSREWDARNPEKRSAMNTSWSERNPERHDAARVAWRKNNPGARSNLEYMTKWRAANKARTSVYDKLRRNALKAAFPSWADVPLIEMIYASAIAYTKVTGIPHHVDHIVPIKSRLVCGLHVANNLQILTKIENIKKGNRYWPDMP